jgi:hypothetical protein
MDAGTVAVVLPSAALLSIAGWCLKRAVEMLLKHDRDIAVIKSRIGLTKEVEA